MLRVSVRLKVLVWWVSFAALLMAGTNWLAFRATPLTFAQAVEELRRHAGTQFRRDAVEALIAILTKEGKLPGAAPA